LAPIWLLSWVMVTSLLPAATRFRVAPAIAVSLTVLLALLISLPSTVRMASIAALLCLSFCVPSGS
jgi:hypothetical protein